MKRALLFAASVAVLLAGAPAFAAQPGNSTPLYAVSTEGDRHAFIAPGTRQQGGGKADVWGFVAETAPPDINGTRIVGAWTHMQYDCAGRISTTAEVVALDDKLNVAFTGTPTNPTTPVKPGSIDSVMFEYACNGTQGWNGAALSGVSAATQATQGH